MPTGCLQSPGLIKSSLLHTITENWMIKIHTPQILLSRFEYCSVVVGCRKSLIGKHMASAGAVFTHVPIFQVFFQDSGYSDHRLRAVDCGRLTLITLKSSEASGIRDIANRKRYTTEKWQGAPALR